MRLVAASPGPGLMASAPPSPETIPNNHFSYAIQWFLFAGIAVDHLHARAALARAEAKGDDAWLS